jgi:hypothetical protein
MRFRGPGVDLAQPDPEPLGGHGDLIAGPAGARSEDVGGRAAPAKAPQLTRKETRDGQNL